MKYFKDFKNGKTEEVTAKAYMDAIGQHLLGNSPSDILRLRTEFENQE